MNRRFLWRWQDPKARDAEAASGLAVLKEHRILPGIGREFMPPLDEGSFLYMPSLLPQAGLGAAVEVNAKQDMAIASVPAVESVVGKLGRAESALDPAPIGMMESIISLKPESDWRHIPVKRVFSEWPGWLKKPLTWVWPEHRVITKSEILTEVQEKTAIPGVLPTFLQLIQTRLVMLKTGFRAMMGVKIYGSDLKEIERVGLEIVQLLKHVPGATDIVGDRIVGKPYLHFKIDRDRIARYGVNIRDVQDVIEIAIGGMNIMESVEGRERYPVRAHELLNLKTRTIMKTKNILGRGLPVLVALLATCAALFAPHTARAQGLTLANPHWNITLTDYGYSDFLLDNTLGFEGREYLSGEWGAAIAYQPPVGAMLAPRFLDPMFLFPDWATHTTFGVQTPLTQTGLNADNLPIAQSVLTNGQLEITLRVEMLDTVVGTPMGTRPASAGGSNTFINSSRYVHKQTATIRNVTGTGITNVQFFQFLHGVQSERGVYDNHLHTGPSSAFQYDVTRRAWMLGQWARAVRVPAWKTSSAFTRACRRALSSSGTTASKAMAWTITSAASLRRSVLPVQSTSPCSRWPGCRP